MANKKKNPEVAPTPEQRSRAASSSRKKQRKTYVSKTVKIVLVVIGVLAMLLSVSAMACSGLMSQAEDTSSYKLTGGVAATINGTNLTEDTVTKQIMSMRTSYATPRTRTGRSIWSTTTLRLRSTANSSSIPTRSRFCFSKRRRKTA